METDFDKICLNWKEIKILNDYSMTLCDLPNGGTVMLLRDDNVNNINIEIGFKIASKGKAQGVAHLLEHCMFSDVGDGETLVSSISKLKAKGSSLNGSTSIRHIVLSYKSNRICSPDIYPNDEEYQKHAKSRNRNKYIKNASKLHSNILSHDITRAQLEIEKRVIRDEMEGSYRGDGRDISKITINNIVYGGPYSSMGNFKRIKDINVDEINFMRKLTFNTYNITKIVASVPADLSNEEFEVYIKSIYETLKENDMYYLSSKSMMFANIVSEIVRDACVEKEYVPDADDFKILSVDKNYGSKTEIRESLAISGEKSFTTLIITPPSFKVSSDETGFADIVKHSLIYAVFIDLVMEFYRDVYPSSYGVSFTRYNTFKYNGERYFSKVIAMSFSDTFKEINFTEARDMFGIWIKNNLDKVSSRLKYNLNNIKAIWYNFANGFYSIQNATEHSAVFSIPHYFEDMNSDEVANIMNKVLEREEGKVIPKLIADIIFKDESIKIDEIVDIMLSPKYTFVKVNKEDR